MSKVLLRCIITNKLRDLFSDIYLSCIKSTDFNKDDSHYFEFIK